MKIKTLALAAIYLFAGSLTATTPIEGNPSKSDTETRKSTLSNIFFNDAEDEILFIDFDQLDDEILEINIFREKELMMNDAVNDLPADVIYEINLDVFRKGKYIIEIVTQQDIKIQKSVIIE